MNFLKHSSVVRNLAAFGPANYQEQTGFFENWQTAIGQTVDNHMSVSRLVNFGLPVRARNKQLEDYIAAGQLDPIGAEVQRSADGRETVSYDSLARMAKAAGLPVETDQELWDKVREELKLRQDYSEDVFRRQTTGGWLGMMGGTFHAAALDPLALPGYFIGVGMAGKAATVLARAAYAGGIGAGVNAAITTAQAPFIYRWKRELELEYSVADAVKEIAISAGMGFAIPAGAMAVGGAARSLNLRGISKQIGTFLEDPNVKAAIDTDPGAAEAARILKHIKNEADQGVEYFTPRKSAKESADVFQEAFERAEQAQAPGAREGLRKQLDLDERFGRGYQELLDDMEGTEAGAIDFWAKIEGEYKALDDWDITRTLQPDPVNDPLQVVRPMTSDDIDTAFVKAMEAKPELKGGPVEELQTTMRKVVDEFDESLSAVQRFFNCLRSK